MEKKKLLELIWNKRIVELTNSLESKKIDLKQKYDFGKTPLILAVTNNYIDAVKLFLGKSPGIVNENYDGETALNVACSFDNGYYEIVSILLEFNADMEIKSEGFSSLHSAVLWNHKDICKLLLKSGADILTLNNEGNNLISTAVMNNSNNSHEEIIKLLLEKGVDPFIDNNHGINAIKLLSMPKNESIRYLFKKYL